MKTNEEWEKNVEWSLSVKVLDGTKNEWKQNKEPLTFEIWNWNVKDDSNRHEIDQTESHVRFFIPISKVSRFVAHDFFYSSSFLPPFFSIYSLCIIMNLLPTLFPKITEPESVINISLFFIVNFFFSDSICLFVCFFFLYLDWMVLVKLFLKCVSQITYTMFFLDSKSIQIFCVYFKRSTHSWKGKSDLI